MNSQSEDKLRGILNKYRDKFPSRELPDNTLLERIIDENKLSIDEINELEEEILSRQRRHIGQYVTPRDLVSFITKLADIKDEDIVLDPVVGTGTFLNEVHNLNNKTKLYGIDIDGQIVRWARRFARYRKQEIIYINQNSLHDFPDFLPKADYIFANLPLGQRVKDPDVVNKYEINTSLLDELLIQKIFSSLSENGQAFVVVRESMLIGEGSTQKVREYLQQKGSIDAIISLPAEVFAPYTNIKTSILVFSKKKNKGTALYKLESIPKDNKIIEDIRNHLFGKITLYANVIEDLGSIQNWSVLKYLDDLERQNLLDTIPLEYELKKIGDICEINTVSPQDINPEEIDFIISSTYNPGKILDLENTQQKSNSARYFALKITDPKVSNIYLKALLGSNFADLTKVSKGMTIKFLTKKAIEDFEIPIVSEQAQDEIAMKLSNIKSIKDKLSGLITEIEKAENGNIFELTYDPEESLNNLVSKSNRYHQLLPKPLAVSYYSYTNIKNIDKKFENIVNSYSTVIKTLGFISLIALSTITDEKLPDKIRNEVDPSKPISDGVWGKIIQLSVKRFEDINCFLSDELRYIDYNEIVKLINDLTIDRNIKAHPNSSFSRIQKEKFILRFQNNLNRLLDNFSFLTNSPLVYFEKTEYPPRKVIHTVRYLIGDDMHDKEGSLELRDAFDQTLYLLKNMPNKSLSLYPLMIYEDSEEIESEDIFFFSGLDNRKDPYYTSITKGEKIVRPEYRDDVHKIFYYIPKEYSENV